jgi:hypothetical protein
MRCEKVGVAPDAPLAVGAATKRGEGVACMFDGFATLDGREIDFEEVPADGEIAIDGDLLNVGAAGEADLRDHRFEADGELVAMHGRIAWSEEDYVVRHEIELSGEVSGSGGFAPSVDEGVDFFLV